MNQDKRKHNDFEESDDSESPVEEPIQLNQKGDMEEEINLDFAFFDPKPEHFNSVKTLLNSYLEGISFKSSQLADLVVNQQHIGTMVGVEDSPDVFGFVSIININQHKDQSVLGEILHFVIQKSKHYNKNHAQFEQILTRKMGLLLNERVLNTAPQLIPILHNQLSEDIKWTLQDDPKDQVLDIEYLLVISKCFKEPKQQIKKQVAENQDVIYQKFEDHQFLSGAELNFRIPVENNKATDVTDYLKTEQEGQQCYRLVYVIQLNEYLANIQKLESLLSN